MSEAHLSRYVIAKVKFERLHYGYTVCGYAVTRVVYRLDDTIRYVSRYI